MPGSKKFASGKNAKGVCDRSGFVFPLKELVEEPGTGLLVHYSESDGMWSRAKHAQLFPPKDIADAVALENPRPERNERTDFLVPFIETNTGDPLFGDLLNNSDGSEVLVNRKLP